MTELVTLLTEVGTTVTIVGLFIWNYITNSIENRKILKRIDDTNLNIAKSIEAINNSVEVLKNVYFKN